MPDVDGASPLLDQFRRGDVPRDLREQAAQGALLLRPVDQLTLLSWLAGDKDSAIVQAAEATLTKLVPEAVRSALARPETSEAVRQFFAARGVTPGTAATDGQEAPVLLEHAQEDAAADVRPVQLSMLSVVDRMKLAMKGTREQRVTLIRDSNKMVALSVLGSPKLSETEVEAFARMGNVAEDVLRTIGTTRAWLKHYGVIAALARNPKTPLAIAMALVSRLNERDVKGLSVDRNVAEAVRVTARKFLATGAARRR